MAKIIYEVKQNKNTFSAAFGKWYAQIKNLETLNTRKLANHISEHGSIYTPDVVYGVLEKFRSCLLEMLLNSKKVKIEGLGTFYCTLENQKKGALKKEDFNVNKHLKALHIRFLPSELRVAWATARLCSDDDAHSLTKRLAALKKKSLPVFLRIYQ